MFGCCYKIEKIATSFENETTDEEIQKAVDKIVYAIIYNKISNFVLLNDSEINAILDLSQEDKINILKLYNKCIQALSEYVNEL